MLQEAIVTNIREDGLAEVVVERLGICGGDCNGCEGCKYDNLMKSVVRDPIGVHRGQRVMIETPTAGVFKGALAIYVLPLVMLMLGYALGAIFALSEGLCVAFSLGASAAGVLIARSISRKRHAAEPFPAQIVDIIQS